MEIFLPGHLLSLHLPLGGSMEAVEAENLALVSVEIVGAELSYEKRGSRTSSVTRSLGEDGGGMEFESSALLDSPCHVRA